MLVLGYKLVQEAYGFLLCFSCSPVGFHLRNRYCIHVGSREVCLFITACFQFEKSCLPHSMSIMGLNVVGS